MAREIKFRFWNHASKSFCYDRLIDSDGDIFKQSPAFDDYYCELTECDEVTACQYTDLKDKSGTEIYEGDVVKVEKEIGIIEFKEGVFCVTWLKKSWLSNQIHILKRHIEIIGNIYENPELLGGE